MINVSPRQLREILGILRRHVPDCEVRVFGSRITETVKRYSDLDLAIVAEESLTEDRLAALREEFQNSDLPFRVDVVDWQAVSQEFRQVIHAGYEVIYRPAVM